MTIRSTSLAVLAFAMAVTAPAFAADIPLHNTGVDDSGNPLANGVLDTHYTLVGYDAPRAADESNGYPIGPWLGNDAKSAWIGPQGDSILDGPGGPYDYQVSFTLAAGLNPALTSISGRWSTDDVGYDILINGQSTGNYAPDFTNWYDFSINSGFVSGVNTIDFLVYNFGGPTGLRVEMTGSGAVPEPASWAMMLGGFGLVGGAMRSRRKVAIRFV